MTHIFINGKLLMLTLVVLSFTSILPHNLAAPLYAKVAGNNPNSSYPPITPTSSGSSDNTDNQPQYHGTSSNNNQPYNHGSDGGGNDNGHHSTSSNNNQHHGHGNNGDGSGSEDDIYGDDGSGSEDDNSVTVEVTQ